jgi:hypothetical protein
MPSFMVGAKAQRREDRLAAMPARRDDLNPGGIIHQVWWSNTEGGVAAAWSPTVPPYPALRSLVVSPTAIGYIYPWTKAFTALSVPKPYCRRSSLWSLSSLLLPLSILISHAHNATEQQKSLSLSSVTHSGYEQVFTGDDQLDVDRPRPRAWRMGARAAAASRRCLSTGRSCRPRSPSVMHHACMGRSQSQPCASAALAGSPPPPAPDPGRDGIHAQNCKR